MRGGALKLGSPLEALVAKTLSRRRVFVEAQSGHGGSPPPFLMSSSKCDSHVMHTNS